MYSVVLMAALTTAPEAPGCWLKNCGCHGYNACYGCAGCYGCYGCYGCSGGCWGCYGCYGFYGGCAGTYYSPYRPAPMYMIPPGKGEAAPPPKKDDRPVPMKDEPKKDDPKKDDKKDEKKDNAAAGNAAKLTVDLPPGARLFVDNQPVNAAGVKTFNTPALVKGQAYYYTVRAELVRDGKPVSETRMVIVRAGETSRVAFPELAGGAAEKPVATAASR